MIRLLAERVERLRELVDDAPSLSQTFIRGKSSALYVDVVDGEIRAPDEAVDPGEAEIAVELVQFSHGFFEGRWDSTRRVFTSGHPRLGKQHVEEDWEAIFPLA